jgi:hypothetical protein
MQRAIVGLLNGNVPRQVIRGTRGDDNLGIDANWKNSGFVRSDAPKPRKLFTVRRACISLLDRGILTGRLFNSLLIYLGSLRRKTFTRPLPEGAETYTRKGELFAKWRDGNGKTRTAPVTTAADGSLRIVLVQRATGSPSTGTGATCSGSFDGLHKTAAAEQVLRDLNAKAERIRCGVATAAETKTVERQQGSIGEHIAAFLDHRKGAGPLFTTARKPAINCDGLPGTADSRNWPKWTRTPSNAGLSGQAEAE